MRLALLLALTAIALGGCKQDFDSRYAETEKQLKADAKRLDKEMEQEAKKEPGAPANRPVRR